MATPEELQKVVKSKILPEMDESVSEDLYFNKMMATKDTDSENILTNYLWIRNVVKEKLSWDIKNLSTRLYKMRETYPSEFIVEFIDRVDISEGIKFTPILITYATVSPAKIPRDLNCSFKGHWISENLSDELLNAIVKNLNHEHPGMDSLIDEFFVGEKEKDTYTYNYEDYEKRSRKDKIRIERTIHEPLYIKNVQMTNNETKEEITYSLCVLQQFVMSESKKFKGARSPGLALRLFEDLFSALERFMVGDDQDEEEILQQAEAGDEDDEPALVSEKCPNCGWVLSAGKEKCPMCGTDVTLLDTKEKDYSSATALSNAEDSRNTDRLLESLKSMVEIEDPDQVEAKEKIIGVINKSVESDKVGAQLIKSINSENIEDQYRFLIKTIQIELSKFEIIPFGSKELNIQELSYDKLLMVENLIKEDFTEYHPAILSFASTVPRIPAEITLNAVLNPSSNRRELKWQSKGEDLGLTKKLNSLQFREFTEDIFGGEGQRYVSHFQAKKLDILERLVDVEGMEYELPFMVKIGRFHSRLRDAPEDKSYIILNQFLKSKAENYSGFIPLSKTLVLLDAVIAGVKMVLGEFTETEVKKEPKKNIMDDFVDDSILGDDDDDDSWDDSEEELDLSSLDEAVDVVETPDDEDVPESLIDMVKGPTMKDVRAMEKLESQKELEKAKETKISEMETPDQEFDFDDILGGDEVEEEEPQGPPPIPDEIVQQCQKYEINAHGTLEELEQKSKELQFQRVNLNDMIKQAREAQTGGLINPEQLNQQLEMIKNEALKLNEQIMLVEQLKQLKK